MFTFFQNIDDANVKLAGRNDRFILYCFARPSVIIIMRTRIKFCGITRPEDAEFAARLGVDAIGLVFYPPSPRTIDINLAIKIVNVLPPFVTVAGLFVDATHEAISRILDNVNLHILQFHGTENQSQCERYDRPYYKALRIKPDANVKQMINEYPTASGILLDTYRKGIPGGTGESFDWSIVPAQSTKPIILAGGLNAENIENAILQTKPYAIDVSGGIEAEKGIKDPQKMNAVVKGVNNADKQYR